MTIKNDFASYIDGNGLVSPSPVASGVLRGSDNGPLFTSIYYIMLLRNASMETQDYQDYYKKINSCVNNTELHRAPGDTSPDEIDDYMGVYAGFSVMGEIPGFKLPIRLWRFPQLIYASLCASRFQWTLLAYPLEIFTALLIAFSNVNDDLSDSNSRQITWCLIQAVKDHSLLCSIASKIWYRRLNKAYGMIDGMKAVAGLYYLPSGPDSNPYSKYWID